MSIYFIVGFVLFAYFLGVIIGCVGKGFHRHAYVVINCDWSYDYQCKCGHSFKVWKDEAIKDERSGFKK